MNSDNQWFFSNDSEEFENILEPASYFESHSNFSIQKSYSEAAKNTEKDVMELENENENLESTQKNEEAIQPKFRKMLYMKQEPESSYKSIGHFIISPNEVFERPVKGFELKKPYNYVVENDFQVGASSNSITNIGLYTTGISQVHSTITYKDHLRPYFIFMLCLNRIQTQRHRKRSLISKLPKELHSLIVSYLGETKSYYIRDEGSNEGTYQIVRPDKPTFLKSGQMFRITKDVSINIFEVQNKGSLKLSRTSVNIIKKLIKYDRVELLGLDSSQSRVIQTNLKSFNKNKSPVTRNLKWGESCLRLEMPYIAAEIQDRKKNVTAPCLISPHTQLSFVIGRSEEADIYVDDPSCSRKHCMIFYDYKAQAWKIEDGANNTPSLFGTWESLQTIQQRKERAKSKEVLIADGSKFMFSDLVYDFTFKKVKIDDSHSLARKLEY